MEHSAFRLPKYEFAAVPHWPPLVVSWTQDNSDIAGREVLVHPEESPKKRAAIGEGHVVREFQRRWTN